MLGGRVRVVLLAGFALVVLQVVFMMTLVAPTPPDASGEMATLEMAFAALDRGSLPRARQIATIVRDEHPDDPVQAAGAALVLGIVAAAEAERMWGEDQQRYYLSAARHLEEAHRHGLSDARRAEALFLLGKSLCLSGQYTASRAPLEEALGLDPQRQAEIHGMLATAWLRGVPPELERALQSNTAFLADQWLSPDQRHEGLLVRGQILLAQARPAECLETLAQIPPQSRAFAEAILLRGRVLMQEAEQLRAQAVAAEPADRLTAQQKFQEAIDVLRQAQARGAASEATRRESMYLIGICLLAMDQPRAALEQFARTRQADPESPQGVAAAFEEAELLRRFGRDDEAVEAYRRAAAAIRVPDEYHSQILPLEAARQRLLDASQAYLDSARYPQAAALTEVLARFLSESQSLQLAAQAHEAWGRSLGLEAERATPAKRRELLAQSRAQLRRAGDLYARLAEVHFTTRSYPDDLWNSAECYLGGHDFRQAVRMLDAYLKNELRRRRPRALLNLGEAQLALRNPAKALEALHECIDGFPNDAASYRARLLAAKAYLELDRPAEAESLLRDNLENGQLTPKSAEWRDSLFAYGSLLQMQGHYDEAIRRLEEAVARYPDAPQAIDSRYLIAEAYRRAARVPLERLQTDSIEISRIAHAKQVQQLLTAAIGQYEQVQDLLTRRQQQAQLDALEQATLRNCYFGRGAALYDLGRYSEAIAAYSAAINRFQHDPEVLEAFVQIAACYRRMNKPEEARGTLRQAKVVLDRIDRNAPFTMTTIHTMQEWGQLLDWQLSL